jgi:hypothetical protein
MQALAKQRVIIGDQQANAFKHKAVSYKRLLELEAQLRADVEDLFTLSEQS